MGVFGMLFIVKIPMLGDERRGFDVSAPRWAHSPAFRQSFDRKHSKNMGPYIKWKIKGSVIHDFVPKQTRRQISEKERKKDRRTNGIKWPRKKQIS